MQRAAELKRGDDFDFGDVETKEGPAAETKTRPKGEYIKMKDRSKAKDDGDDSDEEEEISLSDIISGSMDKVELGTAEQEVFMQRPTGKGKCQAEIGDKLCGYVYSPMKSVKNVMIGTPFAELPANFRCPSCGARKNQFEEDMEEIAGFAENQEYGLGFNKMTSGEKGLIIWGGLASLGLLLLGGYFLD